MKALILAAGYGTRLYPLTKKYPKPLLLIAQRPILDYIAKKLAEIKEIDEIIIITNDKFYPNFLDWENNFQNNHSFRIKVLNDGTRSEFDRLGAIGDINFALVKENIQDDVIIFGGDNMFEEGLSSFREFALSKRPKVTMGVYDIGKKDLAGKYGVVRLDAESRIIDFAEKPSYPQSSLIATCLYYLPEERLKYFTEYLKDAKNERDSSGSFISWLSKKEDVYGFIFRKHWYDIGDPHMYQEADRVFTAIAKSAE